MDRRSIWKYDKSDESNLILVDASSSFTANTISGTEMANSNGSLQGRGRKESRGGRKWKRREKEVEGRGNRVGEGKDGSSMDCI